MSLDQTRDLTRTTFAQLSRNQPELTDLDRRIMAAFERLLDGRPELAEGMLTVTNTCVEAGISRASYYRSPVAIAIKTILAAPEFTRPELDELRDQVQRLQATERKLRRDHAAQTRELSSTIKTYANQIQLLSLTNAGLRAERDELRKDLESSAKVVPLNAAHRG